MLSTKHEFHHQTIITSFTFLQLPV